MTAAAKRPTEYDDDIKREACRGLLKEWKMWIGEDWRSEEEELEFLAKHADYDGYRFARNLEAEIFDADETLVDLLSAYSSHLYTAHTKALRAWVAETKPECPVKDGERLTLPRHGNGFVNGINADEATFYFKPDNNTKPGLVGIVIPFEQCPAPAL